MGTPFRPTKTNSPPCCCANSVTCWASNRGTKTTRCFPPLPRLTSNHSFAVSISPGRTERSSARRMPVYANTCTISRSLSARAPWIRRAGLEGTVEDPSPSKSDHRYRGFNFFDDDGQTLFEVLCRGEFFIHRFRNRSLRHHLKQFRASQISRLLKRLRLHGIIKKVGNTTSTTSPNSDATSPSLASPSRTCSSFLSLRPPPSPTDLQLLAFLQSIVR
jgi:hypothetical protein